MQLLMIFQLEDAHDSHMLPASLCMLSRKREIRPVPDAFRYPDKCGQIPAPGPDANISADRLRVPSRHEVGNRFLQKGPLIRRQPRTLQLFCFLYFFPSQGMAMALHCV